MQSQHYLVITIKDHSHDAAISKTTIMIMQTCLSWYEHNLSVVSIIVRSVETKQEAVRRTCQYRKQVALLRQRDRTTRLSVEILQLQNIAIVWHYLRDPTFSRFYTIPKCDRHTHTERRTDRYTTTACTALSIASRGKNRPYCTAHKV